MAVVIMGVLFVSGMSAIGVTFGSTMMGVLSILNDGCPIYSLYSSFLLPELHLAVVIMGVLFVCYDGCPIYYLTFGNTMMGVLSIPYRCYIWQHYDGCPIYSL